MPNYWIGIMAVAFVVALATWLSLVFYADSHPHGKAGESLPHREIMGGSFDAFEGGRQVMPHPGVPSAREPVHDSLAGAGQRDDSAGASHREHRQETAGHGDQADLARSGRQG